LTDPQAASLITYANAPNFAAEAADFLSGSHGTIYPCPVALNPVTNACAEPVSDFGAIVDGRLRNIASTKESGLDLITTKDLAVAGGQMELSLDAAILFQLDQRIASTNRYLSILDRPYEPQRVKLRAGASWSRMGWTLSSSLNYQNAYDDTYTTPISRVKANTTEDLNISYGFADDWGSILRGITASLAIRNLFDVNPPYVGGLNIFGSLQPSPGFDPTNAVPYGRVVSLSVTKRWAH
jgi:hypothetical protein